MRHRERLLRTLITNNVEKGGKRLQLHSTFAITKKMLNGVVEEEFN